MHFSLLYNFLTVLVILKIIYGKHFVVSGSTATRLRESLNCGNSKLTTAVYADFLGSSPIFPQSACWNLISEILSDVDFLFFYTVSQYLLAFDC